MEQTSEQHACAARMMGLVLRHLRKQAGLTLRETGDRAHYDFSRLGRAERGEFLLPAHQAAALDALFSTNGLLTALRQVADSEHTSPVSAGLAGVTGDDQVMLVLHIQGRSVPVTLSRREFTQLLATGLFSSAVPGLMDADHLERVAGTISSPSRVDAEVIAYFRRLLAEHYAADKMLGPRSLLKPVLAQIDVLDELRRGAGTAHAEPLLQVLSHHAEMAGWLYQDLGQLETATQWTRRAAEWAQCAGDADMAAYALVRQSNIAALAGDYAGVVQLAAAARKQSAGLEPKLVALAAQQQARGLVMLGQTEECFALLESAAETLKDHPQVRQPDTPEYLHHYGLATLREQSAVCYRAAGQVATAAAILEEQIAATPGRLARDRGHLTAKLAVALSTSDPVRAAHLGLETIATAQRTGSARIWRELRTLDSDLVQRWPGHAAAASFHDALLSA